jgi:PAS domain S-box-containing protein
MEHLNNENKALHENILDHMKVAVTYVDAEGNILYANAAARKRPSKTPRDVGVNMRECHKDTSNEKIVEIFRDFRNGRSEPHHYVSTLGGERNLVTMIPMFEAGVFSGCVSQVHPSTLEGPERSF